MRCVAGGAAARSGLRAGDQILSMNATPLPAGQRGVEAMVRDVKAAPERAIRVERKRGDETSTLELIPDDQQGTGKIGAQLQANINEGELSTRGDVEAMFCLANARAAGALPMVGMLIHCMSFCTPRRSTHKLITLPTCSEGTSILAWTTGSRI